MTTKTIITVSRQEITYAARTRPLTEAIAKQYGCSAFHVIITKGDADLQEIATIFDTKTLPSGEKVEIVAIWISRIIPLAIAAYLMSLDIPKVWDQDDAFMMIPESNGAYLNIGPGNAHTKIIIEMLAKADHVVASTGPLSSYIKETQGVSPIVVPNVWDDAYEKIKPALSIPKNYMAFVYGGTPTHRDDMVEFIKATQNAPKVFRYHKIGIVFVGDKWGFDNTHSDIRKWFIPFTSYEGWIGILKSPGVIASLAFLSDTPFNSMKSDIKQIEAIGCGIKFFGAGHPYNKNAGVVLPENSSMAITSALNDIAKMTNAASKEETNLLESRRSNIVAKKFIEEVKW